jgi:hypothetical protein
MGHRFDPWQGWFMSSAARLTLMKSSLSSLEIYTMCLFWLANGTHAGFDKHLERFIWESISDKKKYHWVNWPEVCRPKDQGGLGIINTRFLNFALMTIWIWGLFDPNERGNLWHKLLRTKYRNADNIFAKTGQGDSQFWQSINKIKLLLKLGAKFLLGNGERVLFWTDWWLGEGPLTVRFPRLSDKCDSKEKFAAQVCPLTPISLQFRRSFGPEEI